VPRGGEAARPGTHYAETEPTKKKKILHGKGTNHTLRKWCQLTLDSSKPEAQLVDYCMFIHPF